MNAQTTPPEVPPSAGADAAPPPAAGGVGKRLRAAREARGMETSDVAQSLKITQRQVEAMESEQFGQLPGAAFTRGFLRNYARLVGLKLDAEIRALVLPKDEGVTARTVYSVPEKGEVLNDWFTGGEPLESFGRRRRRFRPSSWLGKGIVILLVAGAVAAYFDWFRMPPAPAAVVPPAENGSTVAVAPPAQESGTVPVAPPLPVVEMAGQGAVVPPVVSPASPAPADNVASPATNAVLPSPVAPPQTGMATTPSAASVAPQAVLQPLVPSATPTAQTVNVPEVAIEPVQDKLLFNASSDSWVTVRDGEGNTLFNKRVRRGMQAEVQGKPPFKLTVGNAPKVTLTRNGEPVDLVPHTRSGGVARLTLE